MVSARNAPNIRDPTCRRRNATLTFVKRGSFFKTMVCVKSVTHSQDNKEKMASTVVQITAKLENSFWIQVNAKYARNTKWSRKTENNA